MSPHIPSLGLIPAFNQSVANSNGDTPSGGEMVFDDITDNKNLIFQLAIIGLLNNISKRPGGMKTLQVIAKELIGGLFDTMDSLGQASAANHVAAWGNPILISGILERFGMLPPGFNNGYHAGVTVISGVDLIQGVVTNLFGSAPFPNTLTFAKKISSK